jgi:hypothetical protein
MNTTSGNTKSIYRRLARKVSDISLPPMRKKKTVFIGLSSGAGTSTLAMAYASYLISQHKSAAQDSSLICRVAYVEISDEQDAPRGWLYDRVGIDKRFVGREYSSYYDALAGSKSLRKMLNLDAGINWALRVPHDKYPQLLSEDYIRLTENTEGDHVVIDISGGISGNLMHSLMTDADHVVCVIDPLPSSMMALPERYEIFRRVEAEGVHFTWLINKVNTGIDMNEVKSYLSIHSHESVTYFDPSDIYAAEYSCDTIFSRSSVRKVLVPVFSKFH